MFVSKCSSLSASRCLPLFASRCLHLVVCLSVIFLSVICLLLTLVWRWTLTFCFVCSCIVPALLRKRQEVLTGYIYFQIVLAEICSQTNFHKPSSNPPRMQEQISKRTPKDQVRSKEHQHHRLRLGVLVPPVCRHSLAGHAIRIHC